MGRVVVEILEYHFYRWKRNEREIIYSIFHSKISFDTMELLCTMSHRQKLEEMEIPWQREESYKMTLKYFVVPKPNEWLKQ